MKCGPIETFYNMMDRGVTQSVQSENSVKISKENTGPNKAIVAGNIRHARHELREKRCEMIVYCKMH